MPAKKANNLIAIVNRLFLNASEHQAGSDVSEANESFPVETNSQDGVSTGKLPSPGLQKPPTSAESPRLVQPSPDLQASGMSAVGGCRQCSRTFPDRLSLIHHFVDHFPTIFYSFEPPQPRMPPPMMLFPAKRLNSSLNGTPNPKKSKLASGQEKLRSKVSLDSPTSRRTSKIHSGESSTPVSHRSSNELPYDMCPHCCQTFSDHGTYTEHLKAHETPIITMDSSAPYDDSPRKCEYCDLRFSNEYLLKEHMNVHCRICSICSKVLMTAFDLNLHMGTHSGYSYDCKDCGRCFPDRKALAEHNKFHRSDLSARSSDGPSPVAASSPVTMVSLAESAAFAQVLSNLAGTSKIEDAKLAAARLKAITLHHAKNTLNKHSTNSKSQNSSSSSPHPPPTSETPQLSVIVDDKPESFFKANPYFENIFKQSPQRRRQRKTGLERAGVIETPSASAIA